MDPLPAPRSAPADPLRRLWAPVTIRVAWDLVRGGIRVKPPVLRAARAHALWRVPAHAGLAEAEAAASTAVEEYLARASGDYRPRPLDPDLGILPAPRWRDGILASVEPLHEAVFRFHYADGTPWDAVVARIGLAEPVVRAAREAVRALARAIVAEDGLSTEGWPPDRLDRLVTRIALAAGDRCPGIGGLGTEAGRAHGEICPRCGRALRLFREGILSTSDLFPPEAGPCLPAEGLDLVAVEVHPDHRRRMRALERALPGAARLTEGVVVGPAATAEPALRDAVEHGAIPAAGIRVFRSAHPGTWSGRVLVGPAPERILAELGGLSWGEARGVEALPPPLPPPPSAARWWGGVALVGALAAAMATVLLLPSAPEPGPELAARIDRGTLLFDVDDDAFVEVIALDEGGGARLVFHSETAAAKGTLATGDGRFRLDAGAPAYLVAASTEAMADAGLVAASAGGAKDAVARLEERFPGAAVALVR